MKKREKFRVIYERFLARAWWIVPIVIFFTLSVSFILPKREFNQDYNFSKQFNGRSFVNSEGDIIYSAFWDFLRWQSYKFKAEWPKKIPNIYQAHLPKKIKSNEVFVTFINHASFLIQTKTLNILTDPIFSQRASPIPWIGPKRVHKPGISFKKLPKIDFVVISHNHYDHMDLKYLKKLVKIHKAQIFVPLGDQDWLRKDMLKTVTEMDWWNQQDLKKAKITFLPAKHNSGRSLVSENSSLWGSYLIQLPNGFKLYFGGDSGYGVHYKEIRDKLGAPDLSLLPIGAYEPYQVLKDVHMNPRDAVLAHIDLQSKTSIASHFGTFQLSDESYWKPLIDFNKSLILLNISDKDFILPSPGQTYKFKL